eukprot:snap_masked-scaffold_6-processed-gene-6.36-mRNA-1 protein AED:1.00 eAED:1.00 QI:0/-1/0/0/-1/1/1/0/87
MKSFAEIKLRLSFLYFFGRSVNRCEVICTIRCGALPDIGFADETFDIIMLISLKGGLILNHKLVRPSPDGRFFDLKEMLYNSWNKKM